MLAEALLCLALNVYHEARGEPPQGQIAVALVTRNRAIQGGQGVCWEVFRAGQFSWTDVREKRASIPTGKEWEQAKQVAHRVLYGEPDFTRGATFYHTKGRRTLWAGTLERVGVWGDHVFYRVPARGVVKWPFIFSDAEKKPSQPERRMPCCPSAKAGECGLIKRCNSPTNSTSGCLFERRGPCKTS